MVIADGVILFGGGPASLARELTDRVVTAREVIRDAQPSHGPPVTVLQLTTRPRTSGDTASCPRVVESSAPTNTWVYSQTPSCGEVRGRVIDVETGQPLPGATLSIDGMPVVAPLDSAGVFLIRRDRSDAAFATLRAEYQGREGIVELARPTHGYAVEFRLTGFHGAGGPTVVSIRELWRC
jgi:hypothetical protein